jgi:hypothetical protein
MYGWILTIILSGVIGFGAWYYYTTTQKKLADQAAELAIMEGAINSYELRIQAMSREAETQAENNRILTLAIQAADDEQRRLHKILRSHDLTALAKAKPGLIENRINDGTKKVFDDIESTSTPE